MADDIREYVIRVEGRVQGVGFRYFTARTAGELGLRGMVRNMGDGTVEVVAQGPREALLALVKRLRSGPGASSVSNVRLDERAVTELFDSFKVGPDGY